MIKIICIFILILPQIISATQKCELTGKGFTKEQKQKILDEHNNIRNIVASGKMGNLPTSSNMRSMTWDEELEDLAQEWTNACSHGSRTSTKSYQSTGRNEWAAMNNIEDFSQQPIDDYVKGSLSSWTKNGENYDPKNIKPFNYDSSFGTFTQVAWATSIKLGCAVSGWKGTNWKSNVGIICFYYEPGNMVSSWSSLYEEGQPCSNCGDLQCSQNWPSLCETGSSGGGGSGGKNTTGCADKIDSFSGPSGACADWAKAGKCDSGSDQKYVLKNCAKTCCEQSCLSKKDTFQGPSGTCQQWQLQGKCSDPKDKDYVLKNCAKTCCEGRKSKLNQRLIMKKLQKFQN